MHEEKKLLRLNLGCGLQTPPGWINVDGSWNARLAKHAWIRRIFSTLGLLPSEKADIPWSPDIFIHDVRKKLPFPDGSSSAVYASHILEHLYCEEGRRLVFESFRVLAPGGVFRIVVPDLHFFVREYLGDRPFGDLTGEIASLCPADRFNQRLLMRWPTPSRGYLLYRIYASWQDFHSHKWMYDADSLTCLLELAGFVEVRRMECRESRLEDIDRVEEPSRIINGAGVGVEGIKPELA